MAITYHAGRRIQGLSGTRVSSNDGTLTGASVADVVTGKTGNAWNFDGSDDYVTTGFTQNLGDNFSVSLWVSFDSISSWGVVMGKGASDNSEEFQIYTDSSSPQEIAGEFIPSGLGATTISPSLNTWYHIVYTIDGTNGSYIIYVNGVGYTGSNTSVRTNTYGTEPLMIGGATRQSNNWFNGQLDQVLVYDDVLTASEVSALYNSNSGTTTPNTSDLLVHYNFEQTGTTLENQVIIGDVKPTNVQVGSRFEETDTRKMYHRDDIDFKEENGNEATNYRSASWYEQLSGETP